MSELSDFLLTRIAEDEWWAREASRGDEKYVNGGVHWQWQDPDDDSVIVIDPVADEYLGTGWASLRTVEQFETQHVGPLPQFVLAHVEEATTAAGGHIVRWDPARVLAECSAKRRIVETFVMWQYGDTILSYLATPYSDHPEYREEWKL